jgi:SAM-dependent methyltransferase
MWRRTRVAFSLLVRNIGRVLGMGVDEPREDSFDLNLGIDTARMEVLVHLSIESPNYVHGMRYEASPADVCERAIAQLAIDYPEYTFVDLGSGKGRPLIIAARYGFRKMEGVEFARELVDGCRENLAKQGIQNAELLHRDVCGYRFPAGPLVVYMFNPFDAEIMGTVLGNLRASYRESPRDIWIIYVHTGNPEIFAQFLDEKWLVPAHQEKGVRIYRSVSPRDFATLP